MQAHAGKIEELVEKILLIDHTSAKGQQLIRDLATQADLLAQLELGALASPKAIEEKAKKISLDAIRTHKNFASSCLKRSNMFRLKLKQKRFDGLRGQRSKARYAQAAPLVQNNSSSSSRKNSRIKTYKDLASSLKSSKA